MLDIHPEPEDARVEVLDGGGLTFVGPYSRPAIYQHIHGARDALAGQVVAGLFARERSVGFEVLYHFATVEDWLVYRVERGTTTEVDPALADRARQMLARTSGELVVREQMRATRYRRQHPTRPNAR